MNLRDDMQTEDAAAAAAPWLTVAAALADLAFEADCEGCFTRFGPGRVLGYAAARLTGTPVMNLLAPALSAEDGSASALARIIESICRECVTWHGTVRVAPADGRMGLYRLALAPRLQQSGRVAGIYGLLFRLDAPDPAQAAWDGAEGGWRPGERGADMLDRETGMWSARTFMEEAARRFDRLDVEEQPGTLLFLGFSRAPAHLVPATAMRIAEELRDIVRPTDLMGRFDATTIALWCDGMDSFTGAERAARFCEQMPGILPERAMVTVGLVLRAPGCADDPGTLAERAGIALRLADLATERTQDARIGAWRVWQND